MDDAFGAYPALQGYPQRQPSVPLQDGQQAQQPHDQRQQQPEQAQQHLQQQEQQQQQFLQAQPHPQQPRALAQHGGDMQPGAMYAQQLQYQQQHPQQQQQQFLPGLMHASGAIIKPEQQAQYGYMPQQQQAALELLPHQMHPYHAIHGAPMVQMEEELIPLPVPMHMKRNRLRKKQDPNSGEPLKRVRSKKPIGAPTRPKSAYMFFLGEFREKWKLDNPESKKVAEVAKAAGEAWRAMPQEQKDGYEDLSTEAKSKYAKAMVEWEKEHPRPARRHKKERDPTQLKRPQSAYFFFLADYREAYKRDHPGEPVAVKVIGKAAGDQWRDMSAEAREPYEQKSTENKKSYALLKTLTPQERCDYMMAVENGQAPPITFEDMSMGPEGEDSEGQGQEGRLRLPAPAPGAAPLALPAPPQPGFDYPTGNPGHAAASEMPHFSGAQLSAPMSLFLGVPPVGPLDTEGPPTSLQFNTALNEVLGGHAPNTHLSRLQEGQGMQIPPGVGQVPSQQQPWNPPSGMQAGQASGYSHSMGTPSVGTHTSRRPPPGSLEAMGLQSPPTQGRDRFVFRPSDPQAQPSFPWQAPTDKKDQARGNDIGGMGTLQQSQQQEGAIVGGDMPPSNPHSSPHPHQSHQAGLQQYEGQAMGGQPAGTAGMAPQPGASPYQSLPPEGAAAGDHMDARMQQAPYAPERMADLD